MFMDESQYNRTQISTYSSSYIENYSYAALACLRLDWKTKTQLYEELDTEKRLGEVVDYLVRFPEGAEPLLVFEDKCYGGVGHNSVIMILLLLLLVIGGLSRIYGVVK